MATIMGLKIARILHAGYVFSFQETQIAFDPIFENSFSTNCHAFPSVRFHHDQIKNLHFKAVFISHYHDDHCSLESLKWLPRDTPIYLYCLHEELFAMLRELGFSQVHSLRIDQPVQIDSFQVVPRRALDEDVDSLFQIKVNGLNILNVVDSWIDYDTLDLLVKEGPWDMVLWPFQTMREIEVLSPSRAQPSSGTLPEEWLEQLKKLAPRFVVPSSCQFKMEPWSWYNRAFFPISYRQFTQEVSADLPKSQVVRINPSKSFSLTSKALTSADSLTWMEPIGEQDVDYEYDPNLIPPSTAEIAMKFDGLSRAQFATLGQYLEEGLIAKYRSLPHEEEMFFASPRIWRLSVFDHQGQVTHHYYHLCGEEITKLNELTGPLSWTTEVPASKLFAALYSGEALTSMYIRINDTIFDPKTEESLQDVELTADPLIRCLFTGVFGAYQAAQLRRIQSDQAQLG